LVQKPGRRYYLERKKKKKSGLKPLFKRSSINRVAICAGFIQFRTGDKWQDLLDMAMNFQAP